MKRIVTALVVSSVSCSAVAGAYVETREAYNTASELHEVILRAGYNFDNGAGLMFTNAYNVGKWDELKHSYNEIEGWYPLFKPTDKLTFQPGGLLNDSSAGSGGAIYLDTNYKFLDWFNYNGQMDKNDTHEFANYWNFKVTDAFFYTFEPHFFQRVNDYHSKNGKDHHWEITHKFSYKIDKNWLPYLELQWLDRWNDYNREQYRIRLGLRYSF